MSRGVIIEPDENGLFGGIVIYGPDGVTPISSSNPLNVSLTGSTVILVNPASPVTVAAGTSYTSPLQTIPNGNELVISFNNNGGVSLASFTVFAVFYGTSGGGAGDIISVKDFTSLVASGYSGTRTIPLVVSKASNYVAIAVKNGGAASDSIRYLTVEAV